MSATVSSQEARLPVTPFGRLIAATFMAVALAALIAVAALAFMRSDSGAAVDFDPTNALRIHAVREYGSSASYDASGALRTHVIRENGSVAGAGALFDHVLRENQSN